MNILFFGDVVAESGLSQLTGMLAGLKEKYQADFVIVNGENAAHGKGITKRIYLQLKNAGADVVTLGNHAYASQTIIRDFSACPDLIRPLNMEPAYIGRGYVIRNVRGKQIAVINLLGKSFMACADEDPILTMESFLKKIYADVYIVDFHGEATSEKALFYNYFADRLTAVIGTHTHVQTADERIGQGCAYITDVGMCGSVGSILGRNLRETMKHYIENRHTVYKPAEGPAVICGCVISVNDETGRAEAIERIQIRPRISDPNVC